MGIEIRENVRVTSLLASGVLTQEPTGFTDKTQATLSFVDGTRTFSITPVGSYFEFYHRGRRWVKTTAQSYVISDVEGTHYVYFGSDGNLAELTTDDHTILFSNAYVAAIYWDATNQIGIYLGEERHGLTQDWVSHKNDHEKQGTFYRSGLALGNITADGAGDLDSHAQCSVANGIYNDEDIEHSIVNGSPQTLSTIAQLPVFYKTGANGYWRKSTATNFPFINFVGGNNLLAYNQFTGGAWQQTEVGTGQFALTHIMGTNDINEPIIAVQGENTYVSQNAARLGATTELKDMTLEGLASEEFCFIGTLILQTSTAYTNSRKTRIRTTDLGNTYVDWRFFGGSKLIIFKSVG